MYLIIAQRRIYSCLLTCLLVIHPAIGLYRIMLWSDNNSNDNGNNYDSNNAINSDHTNIDSGNGNI